MRLRVFSVIPLLLFSFLFAIETEINFDAIE